MTYKELVRLVHPDLNPNITDSGTKISEIMSNKNNPTELMRLAIQWGFIKSENTNTNTNTNTNSSWVFYNCNIHGEKFKTGLFVRFKDSNGYNECWVVKTYKNSVYLTNRKGIFTINKPLKDLDGKIEISTASYKHLNSALLRFWVTEVRNLRKGNKQSAEITFESLGLIPNSDYFKKGYYVKYRRNTYELLRTNGSCVFINFFGEERKIYLKSISKIFRV